MSNEDWQKAVEILREMLASEETKRVINLFITYVEIKLHRIDLMYVRWQFFKDAE